jgi:hypothetical protein
MLGIDPLEISKRLKGLPHFFRNLKKYRSLHTGNRFPLSLRNIYYASFDRFQSSGDTSGHYFWQDLWAARCLFDNGVKNHVDIGSRVDGFVGHILPFSKVTYVDIRPMVPQIENLTFVQGSIQSLPFKTESVQSLSCLHVLEHIGLGRYGDIVDPQGYIQASHELVRVLAKRGKLLIGVPIGKERLCFDAHRVFTVPLVLNMFRPLGLISFSLVNDRGQYIQNASIEKASKCDYGCGLFELHKT